MHLTPDHAGRVTLYDRISGQRLERWPVDARELLATGGYTTDPNMTALVADSVPVTSVAEPLSPDAPAAPDPLAPAPRSRRRPPARAEA